MHGFYSEVFIFRLNIKLDIWGIFEFFYGVLQYFELSPFTSLPLL